MVETRSPIRMLLTATVVGAVVVAVGLAACGQPSQPVSAPSGADTPSPAGTRVASAASPAVSVPGSLTPSPRIVVARSAIRLPTGRSRAVALALGSGVLLCGGLTSVGTTGSILGLNLGTGHVQQVGFLSTAVHDAGGAILDGAGYVFGGGRTVAGTTIQRITSTGTASAVGHLPGVRADLAAAAVDGEIVIVGGGTPALTDGRVLATADAHDLRTIGRLIVPVRYPAVAVFNGLVYVIGGATPRGDTNVIQALDPATGLVRIVGRLPHPLSHASALVIGTTILVAGGRSAGRAQDQLLRLVPATGAVSIVGRLPAPVSDMAAVVVGGVGYLIGGETTSPIASIVTISIQ
jgi:hypothetical protein